MTLIDLPRKLLTYYPGSEWTLDGETYEGLIWLSDTPKPTEAELEALPDLPLPPPANWDAFNATLLADVRLNQVCGAATQAGAFLAVAGLPTALGQVATNGLASFALVFGRVCEVGGATAQDRDGWAAIAEACNLPAEFVAAIRGE